MFVNKLLLLGTLLVVAKGGWHRDIFYQEINKFRHSPTAYQKNHTDVSVRCSAPLNEYYHPLFVSDALENSSCFQAWTLSTRECEISHDTCDRYCDEFGSCSHTDRMARFLQGIDYHNPLEILIRGPKNPYKIFYDFLESGPHCDHILNCHTNSMGASFSHTDKNVFVADFAYLA